MSIEYMQEILSPGIGTMVKALIRTRKRRDPTFNLNQYERRQLVADTRLLLFLSPEPADVRATLVRLFARYARAAQWRETFYPSLGPRAFEVGYRVPQHPWFSRRDPEPRRLPLFDVLFRYYVRPWWNTWGHPPGPSDTGAPLPIFALAAVDPQAVRALWNHVAMETPDNPRLQKTKEVYFRCLYRETLRELDTGIGRAMFRHCLAGLDLSPMLERFLRRTLLREDRPLEGADNKEKFRLNVREICDAREEILLEMAERVYVDLHVLPISRERLGRLPQWRLRLRRHELDAAALLVPRERVKGLSQTADFASLLADDRLVAAAEGVSLIPGIRVTLPRGSQHASFPRLAALFAEDVPDGIPPMQFAYEVACRGGIVLVPDGPLGDSWLLAGAAPDRLLDTIWRQVGDEGVLLEVANLKTLKGQPPPEGLRVTMGNNAPAPVSAGSGGHLDSLRLGWSGVVMERFSNRDEFAAHIPRGQIHHRGLEWLSLLLLVLRTYERKVAGREDLRRVPELLEAYRARGPLTERTMG